MKYSLPLVGLVATAVALPSSFLHPTGQSDGTRASTGQGKVDLNQPMIHGGHLDFGGKAWRFHDLGDGMFVAVEPEKWHETGRHLSKRFGTETRETFSILTLRLSQNFI